MSDSGKKEGASGSRITIAATLITAIATILAAWIAPQVVVNINQGGQETAFAQIQPTIVSLQNVPTQTPYVIEVTRIIDSIQTSEPPQSIETTVTTVLPNDIIVSSFDNISTNGWLLSTKGTFINPGVSGNTGNDIDGHLRFEDTSAGDATYFVAPPIFHGDWLRFSTLQIDLWSSSGEYFTSGYGLKGDVYLANGHL